MVTDDYFLEADFCARGAELRQLRAFDAHFAQLISRYLQLRRHLTPKRTALGASGMPPDTAASEAPLREQLARLHAHILYHLDHGPGHLGHGQTCCG